MREYLYDLRTGTTFILIKNKAHKEKIVNFGFVKIKDMGLSKHTLKKIKRQAINWRKIFATHNQ